MPITYDGATVFIAKEATFDSVDILGARDFSFGKSVQQVNIVADGNPHVTDMYAQGGVRTITVNVMWATPAVEALVGKKATLTLTSLKRINTTATGVGGTPADHEEVFTASALLLSVTKNPPAPDGGVSGSTLNFAAPF